MSSPYPTKTESLVLDMLMSGDKRYGLELVAKSEGKLKRGTVYVLLDRLEDKGLIASKVEATGDGRRRYSITAQGRRVHSVTDIAAQGAAVLLTSGA